MFKGLLDSNYPSPPQSPPQSAPFPPPPAIHAGDLIDCGDSVNVEPATRLFLATHCFSCESKPRTVKDQTAHSFACHANRFAFHCVKCNNRVPSLRIHQLKVFPSYVKEKMYVAENLCGDEDDMKEIEGVINMKEIERLHDDDDDDDDDENHIGGGLVIASHMMIPSGPGESSSSR